MLNKLTHIFLIQINYLLFSFIFQKSSLLAQGSTVVGDIPSNITTAPSSSKQFCSTCCQYTEGDPGTKYGYPIEFLSNNNVYVQVFLITISMDQMIHFH